MLRAPTIQTSDEKIEPFNLLIDKVFNRPDISESVKDNLFKTISILKFISANLEWIGYAVEHKDDPSIYRLRDDKAKGVLRDYYGTSFHINSYHQKDEAIKEFDDLIQDFTKSIAEILNVVEHQETCFFADPLKKFAESFDYNEDTGCMDRRLLNPKDMWLKITGRIALNLHEVFLEFQYQYPHGISRQSAEAWVLTRIQKQVLNMEDIIVPLTPEIFINHCCDELKIENPNAWTGIVIPAQENRNTDPTSSSNRNETVQVSPGVISSEALIFLQKARNIKLGFSGMLQFHFNDDKTADDFVQWCKQQRDLQSLQISRSAMKLENNIYVVRMTAQQCQKLYGTSDFIELSQLKKSLITDTNSQRQVVPVVSTPKLNFDDKDYDNFYNILNYIYVIISVGNGVEVHFAKHADAVRFNEIFKHTLTRRVTGFFRFHVLTLTHEQLKILYPDEQNPLDIFQAEHELFRKDIPLEKLAALLLKLSQKGFQEYFIKYPEKIGCLGRFMAPLKKNQYYVSHYLNCIQEAFKSKKITAQQKLQLLMQKNKHDWNLGMYIARYQDFSTTQQYLLIIKAVLEDSEITVLQKLQLLNLVSINGWNFGMLIIRNQDAITTQQYLMLIEDLLQSPEITLQQRLQLLLDKSDCNLGMEIARHQDASIAQRYLKLFNDVLQHSEITALKKLQLLMQENVNGWNLGMYIARNQDAIITQQYLTLIKDAFESPEITAQQKLQLLVQHAIDGWELGMLIARYQDAITTQQYLILIEKLIKDDEITAQQKLRLLNWSLGVLITHNQDATTTQHFLVLTQELFKNKEITIDKIFELQLKMNKDGWKLGMYIACYQDAATALQYVGFLNRIFNESSKFNKKRKLQQKQSSLCLEKNNNNYSIFTSILRYQSSQVFRQLLDILADDIIVKGLQDIASMSNSMQQNELFMSLARHLCHQAHPQLVKAVKPYYKQLFPFLCKMINVFSQSLHEEVWHEFLYQGIRQNASENELLPLICHYLYQYQARLDLILTQEYQKDLKTLKQLSVLEKLKLINQLLSEQPQTKNKFLFVTSLIKYINDHNAWEELHLKYNRLILDYHENKHEPVVELIQSSNAFVKIIRSYDWSDALEQLRDLQYRPKLRRDVKGTYKFNHATSTIEPKQPKVNIIPKQRTHTQKSAVTLIDSRMATPVFGHHDESRELVGLLFDRTQCKIKMMQTQDHGTYNKKWVGSFVSVQEYAANNRCNNYGNIDEFQRAVQDVAGLVNEVLANLSKDAIQAVVMARNTPKSYKLAEKYAKEIYQKLGKIVPIYHYDYLLRRCWCVKSRLQFAIELKVFNSLTNKDIQDDLQFIDQMDDITRKEVLIKVIERLQTQYTGEFIHAIAPCFQKYYRDIPDITTVIINLLEYLKNNHIPLDTKTLDHLEVAFSGNHIRENREELRQYRRLLGFFHRPSTAEIKAYFEGENLFSSVEEQTIFGGGYSKDKQIEVEKDINNCYINNIKN